MEAVLEPLLLLLVLLNPFMLWAYLQDMLEPLPAPAAHRILARAAGTAALVFVFFAWTGDLVFAHVLQVRFAAFLLFGGVLFLVIAVRFVLFGAVAKQELVGGAPQRVAGSIAMPFLIGPGTVSASVLAGERSGRWPATLGIALALAATVVVALLRALQRKVAERYAGFVERYSDLVGRISALIIGTIAVEMLLRGVELWRDGP